MLTIHPIPAFEDNYIWMMHHRTHAVVVDPGDANPVVEYLSKHNLHLEAILVTHHHSDHIDGIPTLKNLYQPCIYAPAISRLSFTTHPLSHGDTLDLKALELNFRAIATPGHTLDHICFYGHQMLFCGDTIFSAGCGRIFEGTYHQMAESLSTLIHLPDETSIFCAHEYTKTNLQFAIQVEPDNLDIAHHILLVNELRKMQKPSLPTTLSLEKKINPFLRCLLAPNSRPQTSPDTADIDKFKHLRNKRNLF